MQRSALCRSRRELSNEYSLAKIGVDTAENEPLEVWGKSQFNIHSPPKKVHLGKGLHCSVVRAEANFCDAPPVPLCREPLLPQPAVHAEDTKVDEKKRGAH